MPTDLEKFCSRTSFVERLDEAWREANKNIIRAAEEAKGNHDAKYKPLDLKIGDLVRLESPATKVGLSKKLRKDWY